MKDKVEGRFFEIQSNYHILDGIDEPNLIKRRWLCKMPILAVSFPVVVAAVICWRSSPPTD
jgi:hypothetical protein